MHLLSSFTFTKMPWKRRTSYIYCQFIVRWFPLKNQSAPFIQQYERGQLAVGGEG